MKILRSRLKAMLRGHFVWIRGAAIFLVRLKDAQNKEIAVLADGTSAGSSQKSVPLKAGNYHFDIAADSPWYITMTTG